MAITIKGENVTKTIKEIIKTVNGLKKEVAQIAENGLNTAKQTLALGVQHPDFTQKHGQQLVEEIGLIQTSPNEYKIVAPISGDEEIAYEMYFAEYGAGIGVGKSLDKVPRAISGYTPTGKTMDKDGYWRYRLVGGGWSKKVNTSEPINYMFTARNKIRRDMKNTTVRMGTKIRTTIKRNWKRDG